jgi:hypothetical protein
MALPWQADFNECSTQIIDVTYEAWNDLYPESDHDGLMKRQQRVWETLWWPAHRPLQTFELLSVSGDKPNLSWLDRAPGRPADQRRRSQDGHRVVAAELRAAHSVAATGRR